MRRQASEALATSYCQSCRRVGEHRVGGAGSNSGNRSCQNLEKHCSSDCEPVDVLHRDQYWHPTKLYQPRVCMYYRATAAPQATPLAAPGRAVQRCMPPERCSAAHTHLQSCHWASPADSQGRAAQSTWDQAGAGCCDKFTWEVIAQGVQGKLASGSVAVAATARAPPHTDCHTQNHSKHVSGLSHYHTVTQGHTMLHMVPGHTARAWHAGSPCLAAQCVS
jgi:hypothetical protein